MLHLPFASKLDTYPSSSWPRYIPRKLYPHRDVALLNLDLWRQSAELDLYM